MILPTLTRRTREAVEALRAAAPIMMVLTELEQISHQIDIHLLGIADGRQNRIPENASAAHSQLQSISTVTKKLSARKLFQAVEVLQTRLSSALGQDLNDPKHIVEMLDLIDEFAESYNTFVGDQIGINALPLLLVARRLHASLINLQGFLEYLELNFADASSSEENEAEFSLVLLKILDLEDFAEKLAALQKLYNEICYLLGVSIASHPLRIGKIESGSLWTRLFGDTRAIGLMVELIGSAARFLHRNYTEEGKISAIPKKIESLDAILDFSNRLKASGADVSKLQEILAKSAHGIADNLNSLVTDQPLIEVNGRTISIAQDMQQALLSHAATRRLEHDASAEAMPKLSPPKAP